MRTAGQITFLIFIAMKTTIRTLATVVSMFGLLLAGAGTCNARSFWGVFGGKTVKASKVYVTRDVHVGEFNRIEVSGSPDVIYRQKAGKPMVEVYASDNIVDLLDIREEGGTLYVRFKKGVSVSYDKLEIRVSSEQMNGIKVSGSGDVDLASDIRTDRMELRVSGSGDINGGRIDCRGAFSMGISGSGDVNLQEIRSSSLDMSVTGSGDAKTGRVSVGGNTAISVTGSGTVRIEGGNTESAELKVSGSGDIFAGNYQARRVSASVTGSGDIRCHATEFLKVRTSGSGRVGYKGNPEVDYPKKGLYRL